MGKDQIQQLILEAKQGNQLAFNQLLNEYWDQVYHFHLSRNVDPFDAEDICIQTFAKAFDKLDRYDSNFQFNTWLITISKNLHIDLLRSRKKGEIFDAFIEENSEVIDDSTTLEEREADEIQDRQLKAGIEKLNAKHQTVLQLRYFDELPIAEIAHRLDQSEGNIKVLLLRARRSLADNLKNNS